MSIFDLFSSGNNQQQQPAPQQQQQPATPGNIPAPGTTAVSSATDNGGSVPAGSQAPADDSPLANFKDLWEPVATDPNAQQPATPQELNVEDVRKAVAKVDFGAVVGPELLTQISAGGEEAQKAFQQAMNAVAQQVMVQSTMVSNKLTEKRVADAIAEQMKSLPGLLREQSIKTHSVESNPIFQNPAVKPIMESTQKQLALKFPNATPAEITKMSKEYIIAMGEAFGPPKQDTSSEAGNTDWSKFITG